MLTRKKRMQMQQTSQSCSLPSSRLSRSLLLGYVFTRFIDGTLIMESIPQAGAFISRCAEYF